MDELAELDRRLHAEQTEAQALVNAAIADLRGACFMATVDGQEGVYRAVEHMNVGPGWMCARLDYPHHGVVGSGAMTDIRPMRNYW